MEKLVCCIQSQGHSKGLYNQSMTVSTILSELLTLLQPNLVLWYILICWSVVLKKKKKGITVFKAKVSVKFKMSLNICLGSVF